MDADVSLRIASCRCRCRNQRARDEDSFSSLATYRISVFLTGTCPHHTTTTCRRGDFLPRCSWEVRPGFNLSLNSRGSFSYQHTVQPPEHGRLEMIKHGRGLAYYLSNFPVGANGDGGIATVYCTGPRWNADHRVSRLEYLKVG